MKLAAALGLACAALAAAPAGAADLANGDRLARQWCANCHLVRGAAQQSTQQGPPSLQAIADSGMPADRLRAFLSHPHGEMPDLALSRGEIDDLIGYIRSLR